MAVPLAPTYELYPACPAWHAYLDTVRDPKPRVEYLGPRPVNDCGAGKSSERVVCGHNKCARCPNNSPEVRAAYRRAGY